jgi:hypothetical protein
MESVGAGMVLAKPITDEHDRVLVAAGMRLSPAIITRLPKWGVKKLWIHVADEREELGREDESTSGDQAGREQAAVVDAAFTRHVAARVLKRFALVKDDPLMGELMKLALRHLVASGRGVVPELE